MNLCHEERTTVREKELEKKMVRAVRRCGGLALKFVSPGIAGVPDRIVLLPGGRLVFAEMKAPGEKPGALQAFRHEQLRKLGFRVVVIDVYTAQQSTLVQIPLRRDNSKFVPLISANIRLYPLFSQVPM